MRWVFSLFMLAALLPLAGCASPGAVASERCRAVSPPGSPSYQSCWQREYAQQIRAYDDLAAWRRYEEWRGKN